MTVVICIRRETIADAILKQTKSASEAAIRVFWRKGGVLRTADAIRAGIHPRTLYENRAAQISRGVYRLADLPEITNPELVAVATRIPNPAVCLISALAFHQITTEIPHKVQVAMPRRSKETASRLPTFRVFTFSNASLSAGVEIHNLDGIPIRIFAMEKKVADCFKFRNKIGIDVAMEALKLCRAREMDFKWGCSSISHGYAAFGRIMRPYFEVV
jgi:predicted transcriptional regulator of viral defense system